MESDRDRGCCESSDHKNVSLRKFLRLGRCPECRLWGQTEKHSARADVFCSSSKTDLPTTLRLWNVDRSNVCFCQISCLAIAISIRPKSAKGESVDCFDPNRSRRAEAHSDDYKATAKFEATPRFAQASKESILQLARQE